MHCIQDILQSNDNDDLLSNASPHSSISSAVTNGTTPSNASLCGEHHQNITMTFFDAVKKWLNGKEKEKKEFGDIMRKIRNQSSFDEISQRARKLFKGRDDFYEQLMLLVSPSHNKSPDITSALNGNWTKNQSENISLQLPTLNETMHIDYNDNGTKDNDTNSINSAANRKQHNSNLASSRSTKSHQNMLNLVPSSIKPINDKKRKRDEHPNVGGFTSNGHNPSKKRKTSNHTLHQPSIITTPTNSYHHLNLKTKLSMPPTEEEAVKFTEMEAALTSSKSLTSRLTHFPFTVPSNAQRQTNNNRNFQSISNEYHVSNTPQLMPHNAMNTIPHDWQSIDGINAPNYQRNTYLLPSTSNASSSASTTSSIATTPQFMDIDTHHHKIRSKKHHKHKHKDKRREKEHHKSKGKVLNDVVLTELMDGLEEDMGLPIHILATIKHELIKENPRNFQLFLQGMALCSIGVIKADQFVNMMSPLFIKNKKLKVVLHQLRTILHVPLHYFHSTPYYAPFLDELSTCDKNMNLSLRATAEEYSHIVDSRYCCGSGSATYDDNPFYKKNMRCSSSEYSSLLVVNDRFVCRSTGAENNPENDHLSNRNKYEIELNDSEHTLTLWDYYVEQNAHAISCLRRLESRILYLYREYKKMFIIRDDYYDSDDYYDYCDSDTYTTVSEDVLDSDLHSTTSEPLLQNNGNTNGNRMDNTDDVHSVHFPLSHNDSNRNGKGVVWSRDMRTTDREYVLSRIYSDIDFSQYLTPICWSAIHRLYSDCMCTIRVALDNNALCTIGIIVGRLEKKHREWCMNRVCAAQLYCDIADRNSIRALDWQPKYKRLDKTRLSFHELWRELIAAQCLLNPEIIYKLRTRKYSPVPSDEYSPSDAASSIKPTRLYRHNQGRNTGDGDDAMDGVCSELFSFRMNIYYNYALRFDVAASSYFCSVINLPFSTHEHCWNIIAQYLFCIVVRDATLFDLIRFYFNFIFLLFEVDLFHEELFPHMMFTDLPFKKCELSSNTCGEFHFKFNDLLSIAAVGADIADGEFTGIKTDDSTGNGNGNDEDILMSHHNRKSNVVLVNRDIYNVLRLYLHLFGRLQKARDLVATCNRWRLYNEDCDIEMNKQQENEREFYGKLMALIQGEIKETEFDSMLQQLFGPNGYQCSNIKYLVKNLCSAMQAIIKKRCVWDLMKLWHCYYTEWKQCDIDNIERRRAILRRYHSDVTNTIEEDHDIVMIEYFIETKEIGIQYLPKNIIKIGRQMPIRIQTKHGNTIVKWKKMMEIIAKNKNKNKYKYHEVAHDNIRMNIAEIKSFSKRYPKQRTNVLWYHPNTAFYHSKHRIISYKNKYKNNKNENKNKARFHLWIEKRFKEISNTKYTQLNNHLFNIFNCNNLFQSQSQSQSQTQAQQAQQAQAQAQPQYLLNNTQAQPTQYYVQNNTQQPTQYVAANYPQYAHANYPQYATGYVAIQQQQPNTSYVMDNRTGSIYAAIPATGHYQQSVYPQTQYVSIPQHILTQPQAQPQPQAQAQNNANTPQNSSDANANANANTMSTPPNVAVTENNQNNNETAMQLPVLTANNDTNNNNNNTKSDL